MTIAVKLSSGAVLVPLKLASGDSVIESSTVHVGDRFVVLDPGAEHFTVTGRPRTEKTSTFLRFERISDVPELPEIVGSEAQMAELRTRWENVDAFYRRIADETTHSHAAEHTCAIADMRVIEVDTAEIPATAAGWTAAPEFLGIPAPLSAFVPGTLTGVPELIADRLSHKDLRLRMGTARYRETGVDLIVEFTVPFSDARTKMVKKDPLNNRRNAKRIQVVDTKYVQLNERVPVSIAADSLDLAHAEVERLVAAIKARLTEPVAVCASCKGEGLVFVSGVRERRF